MRGFKNDHLPAAAFLAAAFAMVVCSFDKVSVWRVASVGDACVRDVIFVPKILVVKSRRDLA